MYACTNEQENGLSVWRTERKGNGDRGCHTKLITITFKYDYNMTMTPRSILFYVVKYVYNTTKASWTNKCLYALFPQQTC